MLRQPMRWSKLKQRVEGNFADGVRGRVGLWTTRYERAHDRFGRSWITVDGREVISMSNFLPCGGSFADGNAARFGSGVFAGYDLPAAMREFLTLPVDEAIASANPLVRALAVLDRRVGRRRLARFEPGGESSLVARMLAVRRGLGSTAEA